MKHKKCNRFVVARLGLSLLLAGSVSAGMASGVAEGGVHIGTSLCDSVSGVQEYKPACRLKKTKLYAVTSVGVPLVAGGVLVELCEKDVFRNLRDEFAPDFHYRYDDYLQYSPAVVMLGLKAAGVESRSSWGRMIVSDAFSAGIMAVAVNSLKYSVKSMRPDGSTRNSFPSGHTATAFMAATMMHKEYGWRSPWYSVGAYALATATGVSRILNNRHWMSDVLAGAGIGIMSVELGYYLTDLIFKDKGLSERWSEGGDTGSWERPSRAGISAGYVVPVGKISVCNGLVLDAGLGSRAEAGGTWFFSRYWGVGASVSASCVPVTVEGDGDGAAAPLGYITAVAGADFSCPLSGSWRAESKLYCGMSSYRGSVLEGVAEPSHANVALQSGVAFSHLVSDKFAVKLFADYEYSRVGWKVTPADSRAGLAEGSFKAGMHSFVFGASASVAF